jgi:hypothetical protein
MSRVRCGAAILSTIKKRMPEYKDKGKEVLLEPKPILQPFLFLTRRSFREAGIDYQFRAHVRRESFNRSTLLQ